MQARFEWVLLGFLAISVGAGCSINKKPVAKQPCPKGLAVSQTQPCACGTAGATMTGTQVCQATMTLSACDCSGTGTGGSSGTGGGSGTGGNVGKGGTGGTGGTAVAAGGSGGISGSGGTGGSPEEDAGTSTDGSGGSGVSMDGTQGAACSADTDCNMGLGCYNPAPTAGAGFCSKTCTMSSDCPTSAKYTCPTASGGASRVCAIDCTGTSDTSCPSPMTCVQTAAGIGLTGTPTYRCLNPLSHGRAGEWQPCKTTADCQADMYCVGHQAASGTMTERPGGCAKPCTMTSDCKDTPSSGSATVTCSPSLLTGGGPSMICGLSCMGNSSGCPTGMTCTMASGSTDCAMYPGTVCTTVSILTGCFKTCTM
jgi:hypothetical protein